MAPVPNRDSKVRIGITSPIVTRLPAASSEWEATAGIDELTRIAITADRLGFHHLTCSEHVAVPVPVAEVRGGTYWDPLATLGYLAARTERIRLATQVLVLGYHHPLEIAKRYGTLDAVSGGRLILGLGVGTLQEEFDLLDVPFTDRGARADDSLAALRAALSERVPSYRGEYFEFSDMVVEPHAVQPRVPLWIGGRTPRSLRRACELADGWVPFGLSFDDVQAMLSRRQPQPGFEVVLSAAGLDPLGDPDGVRRKLDRAVAAGATIIGVGVAARSVDHYCEQLEALTTLHADAFRRTTD
ncbi:LLM class F420-dependent oxidoreductase [Rhodococcus rhodochrous]|uniref:LLM class F420-dependent oxidoreductase n=1 Tax=Rhodococcus rhodochrous TaxID=1829 RepID=A0AA46WTX3_RHORH|nr:LLM class F420-dependent oxidoreductase [Rhodococcus rhodochrous]MCB8910066.1 LLM class F420-dependent oxidoreductase [Rhodococcus rhodochrous]UZF44283.1 LLM class F420-dependent oxidoreductase [Rhodococcus rhodochrous]